jgi:Sel1 repeat
MRLVILACGVALSSLGVALADDRPTVVAVWEHRPTGPNAKPATITLYSNHKIDDPDGEKTWSRKGNSLTLTFPNPKAPGGKWVARCTVAPDGKTYTGRNQVGGRSTGKLVSVTDDLNPEAPPPVAHPLTDQTALDPQSKKTPARKTTAKLGGGENPPINMRELEKQANAGNAQSMYELGVYLCNGVNYARDVKTGFAWLEKAAKAGYPNAMNDLGCCYYFGKFVKKDLNLAKEWISKAAKAGVPEAQRAIATANGKKSWKDMPEQQKKLIVGVFLAAWGATSQFANQPSGAASVPACNAMEGFSKCLCKKFVAGGLRDNPDSYTCKRCLHSEQNHN